MEHGEALPRALDERADRLAWSGGTAKDEAPRYAQLLPELPRLLHAALQPRNDSAALQALLDEQRRTHRLLRATLWVGLGFVGGLLVAQLLLRFSPWWH